ncbi:hypothetical protein ACO0OL_002546 [Hanseniaspora opuntiae]
MLFSSVFNSFKKDNADDDETAGIMRSSRNFNDLPYDHEDRLYFDSPMKSSYSSVTRRKYLDDNDDFSSIDHENDTLDKMKLEYERNKLALQNKGNDNSLKFDDIFGNGFEIKDEDIYSRRKNILELNNKRHGRNLFGYMNDKTSSRDDSIYNIQDLYQNKRGSYGYSNSVGVDDMRNIDYSPLNSRGKHLDDFDSNLYDKKRDLELENLELKRKIQQENLARKVKDLEEREKYEKDRYLIRRRQEEEKENMMFANMKYKREKEELQESLREYERSIEKQAKLLKNQNNLIKDLEEKYSKLVSIVGSQNEEMNELKNGLETERSTSKRLNNRLELLNDRLSDTKKMLYSTTRTFSPSIKTKVRFDENRDIDDTDISDFEYGESPTKFDLNNTEHILKLTEKF